MSSLQSNKQLISKKNLNIIKENKNTITYGPLLENLGKKKPSLIKKSRKVIKYKKINKTKIVATIGPKTANKKKLLQLFNAGMTIARLNGSHNTLEWHSNTIELIKNNT